MSILETFYILFKSDASDVKKGAEDAEKSTKKLTESLKQADIGAQKVGAGFLGIAKSFAGVAAAAISVNAVIGGIKNATDYAIELGNISRLLNVNVTELDAWRNAVQRTGGTAASFQQSLKSLSEHFGGTPQVALQLLPQLADVFQKIGRIRSLQYGKTLGLDESTILLLQQGRREVEAVINKQKELGLVTERDTKIALAFNNATTDTGHAFRSLYVALSSEVLPAFTTFFNAIIPGIGFLESHKDLVIGAFVGIGIAAAAAAIPFVVINTALLEVIATLGVFALAFEDVKYFFEGKDSLFGEGFSRLTKSAQGIKLNLSGGKDLLDLASRTPLNSQTSNSLISSQAFSRNNHVNTGPITIHTQATSAIGVGTALGKYLNDQLAQLNNNSADGVAY